MRIDAIQFYEGLLVSLCVHNADDAVVCISVFQRQYLLAGPRRNFEKAIANPPHPSRGHQIDSIDLIILS